MFRRRGLLCLLAASLAGCASVAPTQVGQMMGTIAGSVAAPGVGGPLGGLVGLLAGMVVQGQVDRVTERRERVELGNQMETPSSPGAAAPAPQERFRRLTHLRNLLLKSAKSSRVTVPWDQT